MELFCEKLGKKVDSKQAACLQPGEYCRFRTQCMIHYLEMEKKREERRRRETSGKE